MFTVEIFDLMREIESTADFETEEEVVEYLKMYEDEDITVKLYDESDNYYIMDEDYNIMPWEDEDEPAEFDLYSDYDCGFDPYEGCYTYDC